MQEQQRSRAPTAATKVGMAESEYTEGQGQELQKKINQSNLMREGASELLLPQHAFREDGEEMYLENFAMHTMEATEADLPSLAAPSLCKALATGSPENVLETLLWPCPSDEFASSIRQQSALLIQRESFRSFYSGIFSSEELWKLLKEHSLDYGTNVDVTLFTSERRRETFNDNLVDGVLVSGAAKNGLNNASNGAMGGKRKGKKRKKGGMINGHNGHGQAGGGLDDASVACNAADVGVVRKRYSTGCSVRLLHPQQWISSIAQLLAPLEQLLQCCLGCNVYLTPADSQGFAPHFDDVDVYILQVEGAKRWRVYAPLQGHALPRYSSRDFNDAEIGEPLLDTILRPGDLLYLPRGTIHQAAALEGHHSMHLTVSAEQRHTWGDFMEVAIHEALEDARKECFAARMSMTPWLHHSCGLLHANRLAATPPTEHSSAASKPPPPQRPVTKKSRQSKHRQKKTTEEKLLDSSAAELCMHGEVGGDFVSTGSALVATGGTTSAPRAGLDGIAGLGAFLKLPGSQALLAPTELRTLRSALACTVDGLMHAMRRSMHSALDKAADKCAAKFVSERLPPLWLQGSDRMHSNVAKVAQVDLRAAYDEGAGEGVAAELRVPAATMALLVDTGDPECLEVRHCMNNSCDQHALAGGAATGSHSSDTTVAEPEEDVLKLPFFLIPRSIGHHVAKRLLRHRNDRPTPPLVGANKANNSSDSPSVDLLGIANGSRLKRESSHHEFIPQSDSNGSQREKVVGSFGAVLAPSTSKGGFFEEKDGSCLEGEVWEGGSVWQLQEDDQREAEEAGEYEGVFATTDDISMDADDSAELVVEVECTLVDLGLWVPTP